MMYLNLGPLKTGVFTIDQNRTFDSFHYAQFLGITKAPRMMWQGRLYLHSLTVKFSKIEISKGGGVLTSYERNSTFLMLYKKLTP